MKKYQNIVDFVISCTGVVGILLMWQILSCCNMVPAYMLPAPVEVIKAFINDFPLLMQHTQVTLFEAFFGLLFGVVLGFFMALLMEYFDFLYKAFYSLLIITQTVPTIAIAPLLVLWFGYEMQSKIVLIILTVFFPITVGVLDGFKSVDSDMVKLLQSMGANRYQIIRHAKLPHIISYFFASLRISTAYAIVAAVISEWLGGRMGLGVYMTRVRKSYAFDKMFAVIFLISFLSLISMGLVDFIQKISMPWDIEENYYEK